MKRVWFLLVALLIFAACSGRSQPDTGGDSMPSGDTSRASLGEEERSSQAPPKLESHDEPQDHPDPAVDFDEIRSQHHSVVVDDFMGASMKNTSNLVEWVQSYRRGHAATVAIFLDGLAFPSALYVLESDGSDHYTITQYEQDVSGNTARQSTFQSSVVVERAYDYVFGADIPGDTRAHAIVIHHTTPPRRDEAMEWDPTQDKPFHGISPADAEQRAGEVEDRIYRHMSVIPSIYGGGIYLKDSVLESVAQDYQGVLFHYRTVGAVRLDDRICYLVYGNTDKEALERGEHSGSVTAVSADGALVFIKSMVDGTWIFADDANQARYPGMWPEVDDFYHKAYAMGYTDKQLERLEHADWASANTALNLTHKTGGSDFSIQSETGRYALDGYLVYAGGEGMTACMYLRDHGTGRVTVLPDWQNGYSHFGFLDGDRFFAAIGQVGGADYEAGVRFYNADSPGELYARWDLTDSAVESDEQKILLTAYHSPENPLLAVFWCQIPLQWGGRAEGDTQTYQVALLDSSGAVVRNIDTGITLVDGIFGVERPEWEKTAEMPPPASGAISFAVGERGYTLHLESGAVE